MFVNTSPWFLFALVGLLIIMLTIEHYRRKNYKAKELNRDEEQH